MSDQLTEHQVDALTRAALDQTKYRAVHHNPKRRNWAPPRPTVVNVVKDRALSGKARRRARKAANKAVA